MLKILKNIRSSLLILIVLTANVEAKNSKDVSNIKELTKYSFYFLNQIKLYGDL